MRFLVDSHVLVWWLSEPQRLSPVAREVMEDASNELFLSVGSVWEIELKRAKGRLEMPAGYLDHLKAEGFRVLSIEDGHVCAASALPEHHSDPFDRLIVAQAQQEGLVLLSRDSQLARYRVPLLEA